MSERTDFFYWHLYFFNQNLNLETSFSVAQYKKILSVVGVQITYITVGRGNNEHFPN